MFARVAIGGAVAALCAYLKSKKAAEEIREDFLADLGYEFDDSGCYGGCDEEEHHHCGCKHHCEEPDPAEPEEE